MGAVCLIAIFVARSLYLKQSKEAAEQLAREQKRADDNATEIKRLNSYLTEQAMATITSSGLVINQVLDVMKQIVRQRDIEQALRERKGDQ